MAGKLTLQQKTRAGEDIGDGMFQIVQDYVGAGAGSAADAAQAIARLAPARGGDELEAFLWSAWGDLTKIVEQIPFDHLAQDMLVRVLRELTLLPDTGARVFNVS
jgi:hypothetical protein